MIIISQVISRAWDISCNAQNMNPAYRHPLKCAISWENNIYLFILPGDVHNVAYFSYDVFISVVNCC